MNQSTQFIIGFCGPLVVFWLLGRIGDLIDVLMPASEKEMEARQRGDRN